jgi:phospholipid/cholesterol/gamma-HCH transport system ATP-binding protein
LPVHVDVRQLRFARGERAVFDDLSCRFPKGGISVVLGGSGSGKTTLLRMLAGLEQPDGGEIRVDGQELTRLSQAETRRYRRKVGMMFQRGALLDSMSVHDNVALPLREHTRKPEPEIHDEVERVFSSVGLEGVGRLLPGQLSGGMLKRAALARAIVMAPELLLCDEPLSGLDPATVELVEELLVDVNRSLHVSMIIASHHIRSTLSIADHIVVLTERRAISGTPEEILASPDPRVTAFFPKRELEPVRVGGPGRGGPGVAG